MFDVTLLTCSGSCSWALSVKTPLYRRFKFLGVDHLSRHTGKAPFCPWMEKYRGLSNGIIILIDWRYGPHRPAGTLPDPKILLIHCVFLKTGKSLRGQLQ
ncbi:hypothetical protein [Escherichia coli]|uniref:hypothetical protein n=1 Tax=Escherichia coli TaxID=562 RepID=UPI0020C27F8C|nr:hypothetical protein [Escherichia coli]